MRTLQRQSTVRAIYTKPEVAGRPAFLSFALFKCNQGILSLDLSSKCYWYQFLIISSFAFHALLSLDTLIALSVLSCTFGLDNFELCKGRFQKLEFTFCLPTSLGQTFFVSRWRRVWKGREKIRSGFRSNWLRHVVTRIIGSSNLIFRRFLCRHFMQITLFIFKTLSTVSYRISLHSYPFNFSIWSTFLSCLVAFSLVWFMIFRRLACFFHFGIGLL
jgi:hypothetical protein